MGTGRIRWGIRDLQPGLLRTFPLLLLLLTGCVTLPEQPAVSDDDTAWVAAGAGMLPESGGTMPEDPAALLHVSEEMRQFARNATRGAYEIPDKVDALKLALAPGLNLQYDADATLTAEQAFTQRRVNCVSFALLFVALARSIDIPANFNDVDVQPVWDLGDDSTSLLYRHMNARVDLKAASFVVIDLSGDQYDVTVAGRAIPDGEALAQFYNNRAVALRLQQRNADALRYELRALELSPDADYLWNNLANFYLVDGKLRAARIAVTKALSLNASAKLSYDTAEQVYARLGEYRLAQYFHERAHYFFDQNPYLHYQLALAALGRNDNQLAYDETKRAITLYDRDSRFFYLFAAVLDRLGRADLANKSMQIAILLTPDASLQERYRNKFARLANPG